jgi:fecR protein
VLGTSFDVTAYEGEPGIYTTLLQGSVEVSGEKGKQLLKPGQQAIYTEKGIEVKEVNAALYCSWIQDRFVFVSEELEAVTRKLERWYDVSFFFAGESLKIKRFSGSIPKYSDLSKVLKMLELTTNIRFKKTDKTVVVEMIQ